MEGGISSDVKINNSYLGDVLATDKQTIVDACLEFTQKHKDIAEELAKSVLPAFATIRLVEQQRFLQAVFLALLVDEVNVWNPYTKSAQQTKLQAAAADLGLAWNDVAQVGQHGGELLELLNSLEA